MMNAFSKKTERATALEEVYKAVRNKIDYELAWNYYQPTETEPELADWKNENNERVDYRIEVYEEICKALEKML